MNYTEHWVQKIAKQRAANQLLAEKARSDVRKIKGARASRNFL